MFSGDLEADRLLVESFLENLLKGGIVYVQGDRGVQAYFFSVDEAVTGFPFHLLHELFQRGVPQVDAETGLRADRLLTDTDFGCGAVRQQVWREQNRTRQEKLPEGAE